MEVPQRETTPNTPNPEVKVDENRGEYNEARRYGSTVLSFLVDRENRRLTGFTQVERFPTNYRNAVGSKTGVPITDEDIRAARLGSAGVAIELPAQIAETTPRGQRVVQEDMDSLRALAYALNDGKRGVNELIATDKDAALNLVREAIGRRLGKKPEEVQMREAELLDWLALQQTTAGTKLTRSAQALQAYFNTRL